MIKMLLKIIRPTAPFLKGPDFWHRRDQNFASRPLTPDCISAFQHFGSRGNGDAAVNAGGCAEKGSDGGGRLIRHNEAIRKHIVKHVVNGENALAKASAGRR